MKKILLTLLLGVVAIDAYSVTLCKKNNTAIAVLNKLVGGTVSSAANNAWAIAMTDGNNVRGISVCTLIPGSFATVNTGVSDSPDSGTNCFCKMMAPATSYWVYVTGYGTNALCNSGCATACATYMAGTATGCGPVSSMNDVDACLQFRSAVYESIW